MRTNFLRLSTCLLAILVLAVNLYGQYKNNRENIWAFSFPGNDSSGRVSFAVGLDFNQPNNNPVLTTTKMGSWFSPSSICDEEGNLLFYTNGDQVWDSDHNIMLNGDKIVPITPMGGYEYIAGSSCIVPFPDNKEKYYVFSITENILDYFEKGKLFYSVVDMSLNGGKGGVDSSQSGILIDSGLSMHLSAIVGEHCNIWLLTCALNHDIKAFEITSAGITNTPNVSRGVGPGFTPYYDIFLARGVIRASSDRKKLIITQVANLNLGDYGKDSAAATLYDFDPRSGLVTNPLKLLDLMVPNTFTLMAAYGACFSPDNSKLYINYGGVDYGIGFDILQFDLSSNNPATILSSKYNAGYSGDMISDIKQGPDGKLYFFHTTPSSVVSDMGNISQPNLDRAACQFSSFAFSLSIPKITTGSWGAGLPNEVPILPKDTLLRLDTIMICSSDKPLLNAYDTSGWDYIWNDGTSHNNHEVVASGKYWVQYRTSPCNFHTDTIVVKMSTTPPPVITIDTFTLGTTLPYEKYQWLFNNQIIPGATDRNYVVTENGNYRVMVTDSIGCTDTSEIYMINNLAVTDTESLVSKIKVYPNPADEKINIDAPVPVQVIIAGIDGKELIKRTKNTKQININDLAEGVYLIYITDQSGVLLKAEKIVKTK